jgi:hypothetical protein
MTPANKTDTFVATRWNVLYIVHDFASCICYKSNIRILTLPGRDVRSPDGQTGPQDTNDKNINPTWAGRKGLLAVKLGQNRTQMKRILPLPGLPGRSSGGQTEPEQDTNEKNINPNWTGQGGLLAVKLYRNKKQMIRILTLPGQDGEVSWRSNWAGAGHK